MKTKKSHFGKRLAEVRKSKNLSQRDLAKLTGISNRMIAHYETKASTVPIDKIAIIAKTMKISLDELVGMKEIEAIKPLKEKNSRLLNKLKKIENLPKPEQKAILKMVDAFLKTH